MKRYTLGFLFYLPAKEVLLIKKNRPNWQRGKINGIGGAQAAGSGETDRLCIIREFEEETGVKISSWELFAYLDKKDEFSVSIYRDFVQEKPNIKQTTDEQPVWVPYEGLSAFPIIPNIRWMIYLALDYDVLTPTIVHERR